MEVITKLMTTLHWPRKAETMTRTDMLEIARHHLHHAEEAYARKLLDYDAALREWDATIEQRVLALIPQLRDNPNSMPFENHNRELRPPEKPDAYTITKYKATVALLEHLDVEVVPPELRANLSQALGFGLSYD